MRIAYLSDSRIPSHTANSVHVMKMCAAIARLGHDVQLVGVTPNQIADHSVSAVSPHSFYGVPPTFDIVQLVRRDHRAGGLGYALRCHRYVSRVSRLDLLYGRSLPGLVAGLRSGLPFIYEVHTPPATRVHAAVEKRLFTSRGFHGLVTVSKALQQHYLERFQMLHEDVVIVAHDAADELGTGNPSDSQGFSIQGRADAFKVGYSGNLYAGRGIELIGALAARLPDVDFHVVGGTTKDLSGWRHRFPLPNLQLHGFIPHARLATAMLHFDIAIAPYQRRVAVAGGVGDTAKWMSPLKIFEYMAAGKAIIASDLPVLRETLLHGHNALLVPPEDIDGWARAVRALQHDSELRERLAQAAQEQFLAQHTWLRRAERVLTLLAPQGL